MVSDAYTSRGWWVRGEGRVWYGWSAGIDRQTGRTLTFVRASKMGSLRTMVNR
jgi:hypothetical protein